MKCALVTADMAFADAVSSSVGFGGAVVEGDGSDEPEVHPASTTSTAATPTAVARRKSMGGWYPAAVNPAGNTANGNGNGTRQNGAPLRRGSSGAAPHQVTLPLAQPRRMTWPG